MQVNWSPGEALVESANLTRLGRRLACADYHELHRLSVEDPERFWPEAIDDLGLEFSRRWDRVLDESRRYIEDFDQTVARSGTPREVLDAMLAKYPAYGNRYTLSVAASSQFAS